MNAGGTSAVTLPVASGTGSVHSPVSRPPRYLDDAPEDTIEFLIWWGQQDSCSPGCAKCAMERTERHFAPEHNTDSVPQERE